MAKRTPLIPHGKGFIQHAFDWAKEKFQTPAMIAGVFIFFTVGITLAKLSLAIAIILPISAFFLSAAIGISGSIQKSPNKENVTEAIKDKLGPFFFPAAILVGLLLLPAAALAAGSAALALALYVTALGLFTAGAAVTVGLSKIADKILEAYDYIRSPRVVVVPAAPSPLYQGASSSCSQPEPTQHYYGDPVCKKPTPTSTSTSVPSAFCAQQ